MSTLTLQEALNQLSSQPGQYNSVQALYDLAKQVSINASGSVTILYSGQISSNDSNGKPIVSTEAVFKAMKLNGESIRIIDDTDAAKFLGSQQFKDALAGQYGLDSRDLESRPSDLSPTKQAALKSMNDALYHPTAGPWAEASGRFVDATVGEVRTLTGGGNADRVFGQTEVPASLKNASTAMLVATQSSLCLSMKKEKNFKLIDLMGSMKTSKFSFYIAATFFFVVFLSGIKSTLISKLPFVTLISNLLFATFIFTIAWWGTLLYTSKGTIAMACDDEREYIKSIKEKQIKWILIFLYWPIFISASVFYSVIIFGYVVYCAVDALKNRGLL